MTNFKHLSNSELLAYSSGSLEKGESQTLGRHLLACAECRKSLPMPSIDRFWTAIMTDSETTHALEIKDSESLLSSLSSLLKLQSGLLWGGAALIIIFSFSFALWLGSADSSREAVRSFENESGSELNFPLPTQTPDKENPAASANSNRPEIVPAPKNLRSDSSKPKIPQNNPSRDFKKPGSKLETNETVSATRGVTGKCGENQTIQTEFSADRENYVFKWKAVPKALKYHLYISDDEEILIGEFETPDETTFVLRKPLDPKKTYKWKIIITLENGQTLVGPSSKFTVENFQTNQIKFAKKAKSDIRCMADN